MDAVFCSPDCITTPALKLVRVFFADVAAEAAELSEPDLVKTLRSVAEAVIVHAPAGSDELAIEIRASLSDLLLPGSLVMRAAGGGVL